MTHTGNILLVDDDQFIRELYEEILKNEGFEVETAVDGKEGLEKIMEGGYDLILLDVMMPQVDGIGVVRSLEKQMPKQKNGPILLLTNLMHDPVIDEALQKGVKACLNKADLTPEDFLQQVKAALGWKIVVRYLEFFLTSQQANWTTN